MILTSESILREVYREITSLFLLLTDVFASEYESIYYSDAQ